MKTSGKISNGGPGSGCHGENCGRPKGSGVDIVSGAPKVGDKHNVERNFGFFGKASEDWKIDSVEGSDETGYKVSLSRNGKKMTKMLHGDVALENLVTDYLKLNPGKNRDDVLRHVSGLTGDQRDKLWKRLGSQHENIVAQKYKSTVSKVRGDAKSLRAELEKLEKDFDPNYGRSDDPSVFRAGEAKAKAIQRVREKLSKLSNGGPGSGPRPFKGQIGHHVVAMRLEKKGNQLLENGEHDAAMLHLRRATEYYSKAGATGKAKVLDNRIRDIILRQHGYANRVKEAREEKMWVSFELADKLLNFRFALPSDGWYHVAPLGEHPHPTKVIQVIDNKSVQAMVDNFNKMANSDPNFPGLLVDYDHFSQTGNHPSEAAGWIVGLQNRSNGLWAKIRWSDEGEKAVVGGRYRLVSPVWNRRDCESVGEKKLRPMILDSLALTNEPNLKGLVPVSR